MRLRRLKVGRHNFEDVKTIGRGAFGVVKLVRERETGTLLAMKCLNKAEMIKKRQEGHVRAERDLLAAATDSPSIVRLFHSFQDKDNLYLVMEYMSGGDLLNLLMKMVRVILDRCGQKSGQNDCRWSEMSVFLCHFWCAFDVFLILLGCFC